MFHWLMRREFSPKNVFITFQRPETDHTGRNFSLLREPNWLLASKRALAPSVKYES